MAGQCDTVVPKLGLTPEKQQTALDLCKRYTNEYNQCFESKAQGLTGDQVIVNATQSCKQQFDSLISSINTK